MNGMVCWTIQNITKVKRRHYKGGYVATFSQRCLVPTCLRSIFCLFLKFGQVIVIRVLMLNFLDSCTNRLSHKKYGNVIIVKRSLIEKKL